MTTMTSLVQLCDSLALPTGFCLLEKRFVDVTIRYGAHPFTVDRWKKYLQIKAFFEEKAGCSIYDLLPGVVENSLRQEGLMRDDAEDFLETAHPDTLG